MAVFVGRRFLFVHKKPRHGGQVSNSHDFINPLGVYVAYASIWGSPATFLYRGPGTVLEWNPGYAHIPPPVAKLGSPICHCSHPSEYY
jgi:hypothetical protein